MNGEMTGEIRQDRTGDNSERPRTKERQKKTGRTNLARPVFFLTKDKAVSSAVE